MKKTTLYLIDTETKDKVWIGKDEFLSSIHIGIQFADSRIWTGDVIYKGSKSFDDYIKKIWTIAMLFSKVWKDIDSIQGNFALSACIDAIEANKLPYQEKRVEKLAEYVLHLGPKIREAQGTPMPQQYITACQNILIKDHDMIEPAPDMID